MPDLITIWEATHISAIDAFVAVSGDAFPTGDLSTLPDGPTAEQRAANRSQAAVEVSDEDGIIVRSVPAVRDQGC